jgi:ADP-heptose:LPS heptosyltransferase
LGPMAAIRKHHPNDKITLLTTTPFISLAKSSGYFDDIWIDERPKFFQVRKWLSFRKRLIEDGFERIYDLQNNDCTQLYFNMLPSPKPVWVGAAKGAAIRNISPERTAGSGFEGHCQTLGMAGINNITIDRMEWVAGCEDFQGLQKPYVLIAAGSAPTRPEKRWPAENYAAIARMLIDNDMQPVLLGTEAEKEMVDTIGRLCPDALNLCGQTSLFDIVALARNAAGAIGNDTGPMHMIAPTGVPTLVLFSKHSNPVRHAPNGDRVHTLQRDELSSLDVETVWNSFRNYSSRGL